MRKERWQKDFKPMKEHEASLATYQGAIKRMPMRNPADVFNWDLFFLVVAIFAPFAILIGILFEVFG